MTLNLETKGLEHDHEALKAKATNLGFDASLFANLVKEFGPYVAQALIELLAQKKQMAQVRAGEQPAQGAYSMDVGMVKRLLVVLLVQHRNELTTWLNDQEQQVLDLIIKKLSGE